jgi:hypothetical protein
MHFFLYFSLFFVENNRRKTDCAMGTDKDQMERTNNDPLNTTYHINDPTNKGVNSGASGGYVVPVPLK